MRVYTCVRDVRRGLGTRVTETSPIPQLQSHANEALICNCRHVPKRCRCKRGRSVWRVTLWSLWKWALSRKNGTLFCGDEREREGGNSATFYL